MGTIVRGGHGKVYGGPVGVANGGHYVRGAVDDGRRAIIMNGGRDRTDAAAAVGGGDDERVFGTFVGEVKIEAERGIGATIATEGLHRSAVQSVADLRDIGAATAN